MSAENQLPQCLDSPAAFLVGSEEIVGVGLRTGALALVARATS